jgi:hypothetical protein
MDMDIGTRGLFWHDRFKGGGISLMPAQLPSALAIAGGNLC